MRSLFILALFLSVLSSSCIRSEVPLQPGGRLSAVERQNVIAIHSRFARWNASQSAWWVQSGRTWHICIADGGIGSLSMPYIVFVFDDDGRVVEANIIQAPNPSTPVAVCGIFPLRVSFKRLDGKIVAGPGEYSQKTWRHDVQAEMDMDQRRENVIESWRRSGSTNFDGVKQMLNRLETNSHK